MADITSQFKQDGQFWVAKGVKITGNFNLHAEAEGMASVEIQQTTVQNGKYSYLATGVIREDQSYDTDICGEVFPKYVRISINKRPESVVITY